MRIHCSAGTEKTLIMSNESSTSHSSRVAKNFVWGSVEVLLSVVAALYTSIAVARAFGPAQVGYFNYIYWLTSISAQVASLGLPLATFKYMGEYLGAGEHEIARAVFAWTLRLQVIFSSVVVLFGIVTSWFFAAPEYRWVAILLVLAMIPRMITDIPSLANDAFQDFKANVHGGFVAIVLTVVFVAFTLNLSWGLKGIAVGVLVSRIVEFFVKLVPLLQWLKRTKAVPLPEDLRRRLLGFSGRGTGLMLLSIVIWDRSDMVILKLLQSDIRQLAFFSVSLSLVDRLMILPQAFGRALSASQMFESGRDKQRLLGITATAARYTLLGSLPLLLGGACISGSAIQIIYGHQYLSAIPVFRLAALFAIPRAMLAPASSLLYSLEDIGFILSWNCICAAIEIAVDIALIPHYAAMGAAIGNGIGQTLAALGVWSRAVLHFGVDLHFPRLAKITLAAVTMAAAVLFTTRTITSDVVKSIVGVMVGALTFAAALRLTSALGRDDHDRMNVLVRRLPAPFQDSAGRIVQFLCSMGMKMEP